MSYWPLLGPTAPDVYRTSQEPPTYWKLLLLAVSLQTPPGNHVLPLLQPGQTFERLQRQLVQRLHATMADAEERLLWCLSLKKRSHLAIQMCLCLSRLAASPNPQVRSISEVFDVNPSSEIPISLEADGAAGPSRPPPGRSAKAWETTDDPRPAPEPVRRLILTLSLSRNKSTKDRLAALWQQLGSFQPAQTSLPAVPNLWHLAQQCRSTEENKFAATYFHMRALMQFAIWVDQCVTSDNSDYT